MLGLTRSSLKSLGFRNPWNPLSEDFLLIISSFRHHGPTAPWFDVCWCVLWFTYFINVGRVSLFYSTTTELRFWFLDILRTARNLLFFFSDFCRPMIRGLHIFKRYKNSLVILTFPFVKKIFLYEVFLVGSVKYYNCEACAGLETVRWSFHSLRSALLSLVNIFLGSRV